MYVVYISATTQICMRESSTNKQLETLHKMVGNANSQIWKIRKGLSQRAPCPAEGAMGQVHRDPLAHYVESPLYLPVDRWEQVSLVAMRLAPR